MKKTKTGCIRDSRIHNTLTTLYRRIHNRWDHKVNDAFKNRLGKDHTIILHLLLNCVGRVVKHITNGVISPECLRYSVIYVDLGHVQIRVDGPNLF